MPSDEEIETVHSLVDACYKLVDQLPPDERSELLRHVEVLREARSETRQAVPLTLMMRVSNPEPSVFPTADAEMRRVL